MAMSYKDCYSNLYKMDDLINNNNITNNLHHNHSMSNNNNINNNNSNCSLTQAGLEEYSRSYYEQNSIMYHHQKQSSYAQSEGYHSYVSSSDSSSTPFLDRLRQDSELLLSRSTHNWSQQDLQLTSSNNSISDNNSSESTSSTETLKWLGSMSDVSVASHATNTSGLSGSGSSQLIAHSSRVRTPQRHNSESILYLNDEQTSPLGSSASTTITTSSLSISGEDLRNKSQQNNNLRSSRSNNRLFPISTYTEIPTKNISNSSSTNTSPLIDQNNTKQLNSHNWQSVAERINELEKQQSGNNNNHNNVINNISSSTKNLSHMSKSQIIKEKYTYFDPSKTHRISNPTLKAFQKNAVQSYFERQQSYARESNHNLSRPTTLNLTSNGSQRSSISSYTSSMNGSMNNIELISPSQTYHHHPHHHHHTPSPQQQQQLDKISANNLRNQLHHHQSQQHIISNATIILQNDDNQSLSMSNDMCGPPPPPPPRTRSLTSATATVRRTSSASEYSSIRDQLIQQRQQLSKDLLGPMIMGPIISVDDWVPERPPKNPMLRIPSPELPPPPPPPSISTETDVILLNQDEPLPPPPPEILRHMRQSSDSGEPKSNVTSRRNSFAGQPSKKPLYRASTFENLSPPPPPSPAHIQTSSIIIPPTVPKKPITMDSLIQRRSSSVMGKPQTVQAHRILLNGKMDIKPQYQQFPVRLTDSRLSLRKRSHNSQSLGEFIIMKNNQQILSPPPLKPRMPVIVDTNGLISMGSKRSNSKASYLPRQPRDKLHSDPDHGSYKLTLTSNEDSVNHNNDVFPEEIITPPKCNLPDVLPVGVKYSNSRYQHDIILPPSNKTSPTSKHPPKIIPHSAPILSTNGLKSMFNFNNNNNNNNNKQSSQTTTTIPSTATSPVTPPPSYTKNNSSSPTNHNAVSPKYMSQSTFDLKKTQIIEPKYLVNSNLNSNSNSTPLPTENNLINNANYNHHHNLQHQTVNNFNQILETADTFDHNTNTVDSVTNVEAAKSVFDGVAKEEDVPVVVAVEEENQNQEHESLTCPLEISFEVQNKPEPETAVVVQRTEIVLRVQAPTSEAASQTEDRDSSLSTIKSEHESITYGIGELVIDTTTNTTTVSTSTSTSPQLFTKSTSTSPPTTPNHVNPVKKVHQEEIDCDKLSIDLISQLSPSDKLHTILAPKTFKSSSDYVSDLFNIQIAPRPAKKDASTSTPENSPLKSPLDILTSSSTYFQISEPKAKLMTRYSREMTLINGDCCDLTKKKEELVQRLGKKLLVLSNEQTSIAEESNANDMLGNDVAIKVAQKIRPSDASKFRSYVDDVGYITMLLLSLSGRLARTENALHNIDDTHPDKKILEGKRDRLLEQLDEAKQLKDDIDRRGAIISKILEKTLTIEEYADYDYFINMKAKLIVDSREITDKIKLGEEQLSALKDTLVHSEC